MSQPSYRYGVVAAGHHETAKAADTILQAGGNAFDATIAAMLTACIAEPILASPGGGGFLLAKPANANPVVYDFFAQTPHERQPVAETDFYPIDADFGDARQTFHIGMGSIATPGFIHGLFTIHRDLCRLPLTDLMEYPIALARNGIIQNSFQHLISKIVEPILHATQEAFAIHQSPDSENTLLSPGELRKQPQLADFLQTLLHEGEALFYKGEAGRLMIEECRNRGGHLRENDLLNYQLIKRFPVQYTYRNAKIISNPPPSLGGTLIALALGILETKRLDPRQAGSLSHIDSLAESICLTNEVRRDQQSRIERLLNPEFRSEFIRAFMKGGICRRGTTQISIADSRGNLASITLSNGEGSGYVIPGTGIMLNNMLGEEDLNPHGFQNWPLNVRMASMMAPTLVERDNGDVYVTGSGGSNRIRSAILQVLSNLIDYQMPLEKAVSYPRIHFENELLSIEPGFDPQIFESLIQQYPVQKHWKDKNLFFGGAHSVLLRSDGSFHGAGDSRRGGVAILH